MLLAPYQANHVQAGGTISAAQWGRALHQVGLRAATPVPGQPEFYSYLNHPNQVIFEAGKPGEGTRVYAGVWQRGSLTEIRSVDSQGQSENLNLTEGLSHYFFLDAVNGQVQALSVLNPMSGQVRLYALPEPTTEAELRSTKSGVILFWRTGQIKNSDAWQRLFISASGAHLRFPSDLQAVTAAPDNNSGFIRLVEAVRGRLGNQTVATIESFWYGLTDSVHNILFSLGHPGLGSHGGPSTIGGGRPGASVTGQPPSVPIPSDWYVAEGDGNWTMAPGVPGQALATTSLHPDPARPYVSAKLVWMNSRRLAFNLVAGTTEPKSVVGLHGTGMIPSNPAIRSKVLAAFNGSFKSINGPFGAMFNGVLYSPARTGLGTLALYSDGRVDIGAWGSEIGPTADLVSFRQNLPLIIDHGRLNPNLDRPGAWGITVGNTVRVWRSGLGILPNGNLIYAAGDRLTASALAQALLAAGCTRAMELDINSYWVTFNFYHWNGQTLLGTKLLSGMTRPTTRYLTPDARDFVYITAVG